jgi:hypothetical protein
VGGERRGNEQGRNSLLQTLPSNISEIVVQLRLVSKGSTGRKCGSDGVGKFETFVFARADCGPTVTMAQYQSEQNDKQLA